MRVINFPPRGIGKSSINKIMELKLHEAKSFFELIQSRNSLNLGKKQTSSIAEFVKLIEELRKAPSGGIDQ